MFFGSGATVVNILRHVDPELEARVVTYGLAVAAPARGLSLEVLFLGGLYRRRSTPSTAPGRST